MNLLRRSRFLPLLVCCLLAGACGGEEPEAQDPAASAEGADPEATNAEEDTAAEPEPAAAEPAANTAPGALPVPTPPASWRATMDSLTVDGVTVRFISSTCGAIAIMPVVQAVAAATADCEDRPDTQLAATFESGRLVALNTSGPGAECVRTSVLRTNTNATCQFQLSFGTTESAGTPAAEAP